MSARRGRSRACCLPPACRGACARGSGSLRARDVVSAFAREWRRGFEELGGAFIKLGQMISVRPDEFGEELAAEMESLCDRCDRSRSPIPPRNRRESRRPLGAIYASIDESPLASASVAQVHAAMLARGYRPVWGGHLAAGAEVVVKVIRPGAAEALRADLVEARRLARRRSYAGCCAAWTWTRCSTSSWLRRAGARPARGRPRRRPLRVRLPRGPQDRGAACRVAAPRGAC